MMKLADQAQGCDSYADFVGSFWEIIFGMSFFYFFGYFHVSPEFIETIQPPQHFTWHYT